MAGTRVISTEELGQAEACWERLAKPLFALAVITHETAQSFYLAGDHRRAMACGRIAIGHIGSADQAALDLADADPAWAIVSECVHEYATLYTFGVESMLADMQRNRRLRLDRPPSRSEARDLNRMQELQALAVDAARALVESRGENPDIIQPALLLYAKLKAELAPPWPEIEN